MRTDLEILHKSYDLVPPADRLEYTNLTFARDTATLNIGDSKEGWAQALQHYFDLLTSREYRRIHRLVMVYDSIRPKGERLKTFGGTASGYGSMMAMVGKIHKVIARSRTPGECGLDPAQAHRPAGHRQHHRGERGLRRRAPHQRDRPD